MKPVNSARLISADSSTERDREPHGGPIGPTLFTQTFAYFIRSDFILSTQHSTLSTSFELPGAPFILDSLMLLGAAVIAWRTTKGGRP
ncbi:MAG: hypothetical protein OJF51_000979 [Nitrospira sp.]|nr:MAG: hypothetical protein OJF51_000979 [Nitrospira sp.]